MEHQYAKTHVKLLLIGHVPSCSRHEARQFNFCLQPGPPLASSDVALCLIGGTEWKQSWSLQFHSDVGRHRRLAKHRVLPNLGGTVQSEGPIFLAEVLAPPPGRFKLQCEPSLQQFAFYHYLEHIGEVGFRRSILRLLRIVVRLDDKVSPSNDPVGGRESNVLPLALPWKFVEV